MCVLVLLSLVFKKKGTSRKNKISLVPVLMDVTILNVFQLAKWLDFHSFCLLSFAVKIIEHGRQVWAVGTQ